MGTTPPGNTRRPPADQHRDAPPASTSESVLVFGRWATALQIALAHPNSRVVLFARDWADVDRARLELRNGSLAERVRVHHDSAQRLLHARIPHETEAPTDRSARAS